MTLFVTYNLNVKASSIFFFLILFQLDGPKAGQIMRDEEPDFYNQAFGA